MSHIVLVHGAWHGAWCWYKVVPELQARGHQVTALDLPGHGVDRTPLAEESMAAYADCVGNVANASDEPVWLVGHSMGGGVISEAAERHVRNVAGLIYLTAFLGPAGAVMAESMGRDTESLVPGALLPREDGMTVDFNMDMLVDAFYLDCPEEDIALARLCLVPQRMDILLPPLTTTEARWGQVPRSYITCTEDRAITIAEQRRMIEEVGCDRVIDMQASHSPFFSAPAELADHISELAAG